MRVFYYVDICTVGSTSIDGLWIIGTVRGHPISGLPHEPVIILGDYIPCFSSFFFAPLTPFLRSSFFTSFVRTPVSIGKFQSRSECTRTGMHKKKRKG